MHPINGNYKGKKNATRVVTAVPFAFCHRNTLSNAKERLGFSSNVGMRYSFNNKTRGGGQKAIARFATSRNTDARMHREDNGIPSHINACI